MGLWGKAKKAFGKTPAGKMLGIGQKKPSSGGGGFSKSGERNVERQGGSGAVSFRSTSSGAGLHDRGKVAAVKKPKATTARSAAAASLVKQPTQYEQPR